MYVPLKETTGHPGAAYLVGSSLLLIPLTLVSLSLALESATNEESHKSAGGKQNEAYREN